MGDHLRQSKRRSAKCEGGREVARGGGCRTLVLVRHGEYTGEGLGLTRVGRRQAAATARRLGRLPVAAIHCSTMRRAVETAEIIAARHRELSLRRARILCECVPSLPPWERKSPGAPPADAVRRGRAQADRAYRRYFRRTTRRDRIEVVVCHGNLIRYFVSRVLAMGKGGWWSLGSGHCGITVIRIPAKGAIVLDRYNDMGHLPARLRIL